MEQDVVIVGGGIAGLTAAAYIARAGRSVVVFEKELETGGLLNSFDYKGFVFDGGVRAIENSGIVFPMLRQLGIDLEFVWNPVSIGIADDVVRVSGPESLSDYRALLERQFPEDREDIARIVADIRKVMHYMDVLYGIDNPLFLDMKENAEYFRTTILPWMFRFVRTIGKIDRLSEPVEDRLRTFTQDAVLVDLIAQHFFKRTPAFFALSYFSLYLDYQYPKEGTGTLAKRVADHVLQHGGEIRTHTRIVAVDVERRTVTDEFGVVHSYGQMIWAADQKLLYSLVDPDSLESVRDRRAVAARKAAVADKIGGDSVLTLYLTVDRDPSWFQAIHSAHFFYTPRKEGISPLGPWSGDAAQLMDWVGRYLDRTTYEISIPALRNPALAPHGKTGLIVSTLLDHALAKRIFDEGRLHEFRTLCEDRIVDSLDASIYPGLRTHVMDRFLSTPLTLEKRSGNSDGAIAGWSFTNAFVPSETSMRNIAKAVRTPIPDVLQAGQWTFSPSGLPISILTGKLAADAALKDVARGRRRGISPREGRRAGS